MRSDWEASFIGEGEGTFSAAPEALLAMLAVSLVGAVIEIAPVLLSPNRHLLIDTPRWTGLSEGGLWLLVLSAAWTLFDGLERHVGRRLVADRLEVRWATDLSRSGVLRAVEEVESDVRRFSLRALLLLTAPAALAWLVVLGRLIGAEPRALPWLPASNGAALVLIALKFPRTTPDPAVPALAILTRVMCKVTALRAIGAEGEAFRHLWRRFSHDPVRKVQARALWRRAMRITAATAAGGVCLAAASEWPASALPVGLLLLIARMVLASWCPARLEGGGATAAASLQSERPSRRAPGGTDVPAHLTVQDMLVVGDRGEKLGPTSFRATLGDVTWLLVPGEHERRLIAECLLGLRGVDAGALELGDDRLNLTGDRHWRDRCAYVPARTTLVRGTLLDNLRVSAPQMSREAVLTAVVAASPQGAQSRLLGLMDQRLSAAPPLNAGELRTVSFVRALVRRPELILIEWEPDGCPSSEALHFETLVRALARRCIVIAAAASITAAHQVEDATFVLKDGVP